MKKKLLFVLVVITCSISFAHAFVLNVSCGNDLQGKLNSQTTSLIITGSGDMTNWESASKVPWHGNDYITYIELLSLPIGLTSIGDYAFSDCQKLLGVIIPKNVNIIGKKAFYGCTKLPAVALQNVEVIGEYAFAGCTKLATVTIGENAAEIQQGAFYNCSAITSIYNYSKTPQDITNKFVFPTTIKNTCTLYVPEESIDSYRTATEWRTFTIQAIPEDRGNIIDYGTANEDGSLTWKLYNDSSLVIEGNGAMTAFKYYGITPPWKGYRYYVAKLNMSEGLTSIGGEAFVYFENISSITIPETVTTIGELAFGACTKIPSLFVPESVTSIVGGAFYGCSGIKSLVLSKNVNSIGLNAFYSCTGLEEIYNYAITPQVISDYQDVFYMVNQSACTLYVPAVALNAYKLADVWKDFNPILPIPGTEGNGIENVNGIIEKQTKFIHEGQVQIMRGNKTYTINGSEIK